MDANNIGYGGSPHMNSSMMLQTNPPTQPLQPNINMQFPNNSQLLDQQMQNQHMINIYYQVNIIQEKEQ